MNGANHAVTALVIKRYAPEAPILWLLVGTALADLVWGVLVLGGIELVTFDGVVESFANINLAFIPYSHSVLSGVFGAVAGALILGGILKKNRVVIAVGIAVLSHVILDIAVHKPDIPLTWAGDATKIGSGLYGIPVYAFAFEVSYLLCCLYVARSSRAMLYGLLALNVATISMYVPAIPGPEYFFASYPWLFPALVLVDTVAGVVLIYWLWGRQKNV